MKKQNQTVVLKKVLRYVRPYSPALIASLLLALIFVAMSLYIPILVGEGIDLIIDKGNVDFEQLSLKLLLVCVCAGVAALAQWLMSQINNFVTFRVTRDIRDEAFRHIQVLPLSYLDSHPQGDTVSRVIGDVDTFDCPMVLSSMSVSSPVSGSWIVHFSVCGLRL